MLNTIIKNKLEKIVFPILPSDIKCKKEQDKLSYAFNLFCVSTILDIDPQMTQSYITEGANDKGIDALYIDEENKNIYFFQSKYSSVNREKKDYEDKKQIGEKEVEKVKNTVLDIMNGKEIVNCNIRLREKIEEIRIAQKNALMPFNVKLYFISNTENKDAIHHNAINILKKNFVRDYIEYEDINLNDIFLYLSNNKNKKYDVTITANGQINASIIGGVNGYVFNLKATELIKIYETCGKDEILSNNLRYCLNSKINDEIQDTIKNKDYCKFFWFFNNGISIISDTVYAPETFHDGNGNRKLKLVHPSIINGGQTTRSLYNIYKEEPDLFNCNNIDSIQVLVRVYQTDWPTLIQKITKGTNTQNSIIIRDLKANNEIQNRIKEYFLDNDVFLETKRGEFNDKDYKIIKNDAVFQMYISLYEKKPHIAKNTKTSIFEKSFDFILDKAKDDEKLAKKFFRSYEIWKIVYDKQNKSSKDFLDKNIFILHSTFALMYLLSLLNPHLLDTDIEIDCKKFDSNYDEAINMLRNIVEYKTTTLKNKYNNNIFFKSSDSTLAIEDYITNQLNKK